MDPLTPLAAATNDMPSDWKWTALFVPPVQFEREWRSWLAQAQQAEQMATLRYWSSRVDHAA